MWIVAEMRLQGSRACGIILPAVTRMQPTQNVDHERPLWYDLHVLWGNGGRSSQPSITRRGFAKTCALCYYLYIAVARSLTPTAAARGSIHDQYNATLRC